MMKALPSALFAALLVLSACETTTQDPDVPSSPQAQSGECEIGPQSRQLNRLLQQAAEQGGDLNAIVAANAAGLESLAREAAGGATNQTAAAREVSCRAVALRAYGALLRSPSHEAAAFESIGAQAEAGERACTAVTTHDAGSRADCDLVAMWMQTHDGLRAARELQAIRVSVAGATTASPVSDETWDRVNAHAREVQDNINRWRSESAPQTPAMVPVAAAHRTRVACNFWAPLAGMRRLPGSGGAAWQRVYATTYPATMLAAADALGVPETQECRAGAGEACDRSRILALETVCNQLAGN
jgi:hypothetical protein